MRTSLGVVVLVLAGGCGEQVGQQANGGWVQTSAALQAHGIYSMATATEAGAQVVQLRGAADRAIGSLAVTAGPAAHSAVLELGDHSWSQSFTVGEQASMVIALDGAQATFTLEGAAWVGDDAAQSLMTRSQPYVDLAGLVAAEAHLTVSTPSTGAQPPAAAGAAQPAPSAPTGPALTCSNIVVAATGAAFFFEPPYKACERALDLIGAQCHAATTSVAVPRGFDCCNVAQPPCFNQLDVGLYRFASASGYLTQLVQ